jgi:hypothetical protein
MQARFEERYKRGRDVGLRRAQSSRSAKSGCIALPRDGLSERVDMACSKSSRSDTARGIVLTKFLCYLLFKIRLLKCANGNEAFVGSPG